MNCLTVREEGGILIDDFRGSPSPGCTGVTHTGIIMTTYLFGMKVSNPGGFETVIGNVYHSGL